MAEDKRSGVVITFFSTASAVGKTLISINMAAELSRQGYRVCLADFDLQFGDVANYLQMQGAATVYNAGKMLEDNSDYPLDELVSRYSYDDVSFGVLAAPEELSQAYNFSVDDAVKIVRKLQLCYDYVIIDTTSMFSVLNLSLLDISTIITFLGVVDFLPTIKNMKIGNETLQSLNYDSNKIRLVLNRSDSATQLSIREVEEKTLGSSFYHVLSNDFRVANESVQSGIPLVLRKNNSQLTKDLRQLVALYTNRTYLEEENFEEPVQKSGGWFSKLFS